MKHVHLVLSLRMVLQTQMPIRAPTSTKPRNVGFNPIAGECYRRWYSGVYSFLKLGIYARYNRGKNIFEKFEVGFLLE